MLVKILKPIAIAPFLTVILIAGQAQAATLVNNGDSWVRESSPDNAFSGDLISVWSSASTDGARRYGVISFDLTALPAETVTDVSLSLWRQENGFSDDLFPMKQTAFAIDPGAINADAATWNEVTVSTNDFVGFGAYDTPTLVSPLTGMYLESVGTALDAAFVESVRTGSGTLMIVLRADEDATNYGKSWGDGEYGGTMDAFISTNADVIPEPGSTALLGLAGMMLLARRRRR
jgi:hypothetical protein